jgi:hypothetical protein
MKVQVTPQISFGMKSKYAKYQQTKIVLNNTVEKKMMKKKRIKRSDNEGTS